MGVGGVPSGKSLLFIFSNLVPFSSEGKVFGASGRSRGGGRVGGGERKGLEAVVTAPGLKCRDLNENQLVVRHYLSVLVPEKHGQRERKNSLPLALPLLNPARPGLPPYLSPSPSLSPPLPLYSNAALFIIQRCGGKKLLSHWRCNFLKKKTFSIRR